MSSVPELRKYLVIVYLVAIIAEILRSQPFGMKNFARYVGEYPMTDRNEASQQTSSLVNAAEPN